MAGHQGRGHDSPGGWLMTVIVEDGSNIAGAEAWADLAALDVWILSHQGAASDEEDPVREAAIRRAAAYLNTLPWKGTRTSGRSQTMSWPRTGASDIEGLSIASSEIPSELVQAQHSLSWAELSSPGVLSPSVSSAGAKVLTEMDGIKWSLTGRTDDGIDSHRTLVLGALDAVRGLLTEDVTDVTERSPLYMASVG